MRKNARKKPRFERAETVMSAATNSATKSKRSLAALLKSLHTSLFDPYRPELHYMRGPGPKWREKHLARETPAEAMPVAMAEATA